MIQKEKIRKCSEKIVKCVNTKELELIYIKGGICCQELLEEIALNILRKSGLPHISSTSDYYNDNLYLDDQIEVETLEKTLNHLFKMIENIDIYNSYRNIQDPAVQNCFLRDKVLVTSKMISSIKDIIYGTK